MISIKNIKWDRVTLFIVGAVVVGLFAGSMVSGVVLTLLAVLVMPSVLKGERSISQFEYDNLQQDSGLNANALHYQAGRFNIYEEVRADFMWGKWGGTFSD